MRRQKQMRNTMIVEFIKSVILFAIWGIAILGWCLVLSGRLG